MAATWVAIAAIAVSVLTFAASQRDLRNKGRAAYIARLEQRLKELERRVKTCEDDREALHQENYRLMQRVLRLENDQ